MNNKWKKILEDQEKFTKKEKEENERKKELEKYYYNEQKQILKKSLPEIKEKIIELKNFFSNYTITIDGPFLGEDKIHWVIKFYVGKGYRFFPIHFKKYINAVLQIRYAYYPDYQIYNNDQEMKETDLYKLWDVYNEDNNCVLFDEMWEHFVYRFSKEINERKKTNLK